MSHETEVSVTNLRRISNGMILATTTITAVDMFCALHPDIAWMSIPLGMLVFGTGAATLNINGKLKDAEEDCYLNSDIDIDNDKRDDS